MRRRDVIGVLDAWPIAVRAQPVGRLPVVGFVGPTTAAGWRHYVAAFVQRLRELGAATAVALTASSGAAAENSRPSASVGVFGLEIPHSLIARADEVIE
jgi:hypothetical protein